MTTFLAFTTGLFLGWIIREFSNYMIEDYKQGQILKKYLNDKHDWVEDLEVKDKK